MSMTNPTWQDTIAAIGYEAVPQSDGSSPCKVKLQSSGPSGGIVSFGEGKDLEEAIMRGAAVLPWDMIRIREKLRQETCDSICHL